MDIVAFPRADSLSYLTVPTHASSSRYVQSSVTVGSPQLVWAVGGDRAVVVLRPTAAPDAGRGEQPRRPHQP